jgi:predicted methyltransferase MtxX (methanogen marker protein 4)
LVRILVVVANIQMRTLKAEEGKGSMLTALAHGLVDPKSRGKPDRERVQRELRKGIGLKFLNRDVAADGNVRESGDVGGGLGKSYLFCLTTCPPWKRLSRR